MIVQKSQNVASSSSSVTGSRHNILLKRVEKNLRKNSVEDFEDSDNSADDNESLSSALLGKDGPRSSSLPLVAKTMKERSKPFRWSCELQADMSKLFFATTMLMALVGSFLLGTTFSSFFSSSSTCSFDYKSVLANPVHKLGYSVVLENIRVDLGNVYSFQYDMDQRKTSINESSMELFVDITPYYNMISYALDTVGVRGVYDGLFVEMDWYVDDDPDYSHGVGNAWYGWFWLVHYTGAITAEKLVVEGSLLLDGSTGERLTDAVSLVREIQRIQKQTSIDEMSFHSIHAFIWHYVASTVPNLETYPTQMATEFCGDYVSQDFKSKSANKHIGDECYHGFGHAVFYIMAMRELRDKDQSYKLDVKKQFRPYGGFRLSDESFCHAYRICGAAPNRTISTMPRKRCVGGIRHSTKLFAQLKDWQEPDDVVRELEERCDIASEILRGLSW